MSVYLDDGDVVLHLGDCVEVLADLPDESIDSVVTDPPYGLSGEPDVAEVLRHWLAGDDYHHRGGGFMGRTWDSFVPGPAVWRECLRVLRPGGHLLAFGGTRTYDLQTVAIRLAGFEIRDSIGNGQRGGDATEAHPGPLAWIYGSGFPPSKSLDVSKAIDKAAGAEREVVGPHPWAHVRGDGGPTTSGTYDPEPSKGRRGALDLTAPATPEAAAWQGFGTSLKPAWEPVVLARKPLSGTVAANVLAHGTGALNVDGCRVGTSKDVPTSPGATSGAFPASGGWTGQRNGASGLDPNIGRWPANVVLSHTPECREVGTRKVKGQKPYAADGEGRRPGGFVATGAANGSHLRGARVHSDPDGTETIAAWECHPECPVRRLDEEVGELHSQDPRTRDSTSPRSGLIGFADSGQHYGDTGGPSRFFYTAKASSAERDGATHPTVKPLALMRWLVRLVTPPGGVVLDPFAGSGTTGLACREEGFRCVLIEQSEEYAAMAAERYRRRYDPAAAEWEAEPEDDQLSLLGGIA